MLLHMQQRIVSVPQMVNVTHMQDMAIQLQKTKTTTTIANLVTLTKATKM